jgi:antitoxin ParD1/3/4
MAAQAKRTFSLPAEQARYIDEQVESGTYASASEVVRAGLRALQERDSVVERWLREQVTPVYDAMTADPSRAVSVENAVNAIHKRQADRKTTNRRPTSL